MAETLKSQFGPEVPRRIADMIESVHPEFSRRPFLRQALQGYEDLELMDRGRQIGAALRRELPESFAEAASILTASMGPPRNEVEGAGMSAFLYLPHSFFVAENGLDDFEASMAFHYELTRRFTAEFSIRPFLDRHQVATLERLEGWTKDPCEHVRRLCSEGIRPRLPWASRQRDFQKNPKPVLRILEHLKDDPSLYVRRSVANNLNDIGKDHPSVLLETAKRWRKKSSPERCWLVRHALRSLVKEGDPEALRILGYEGAEGISVVRRSIEPALLSRGQTVTMGFSLANRQSRSRRVLVDLRVHFVKKSGRTSPKVFKLKEVEIPAGGRIDLAKRLSLKDLTTRRHHSGEHAVDVLINGVSRRLGVFHLS